MNNKYYNTFRSIVAIATPRSLKQWMRRLPPTTLDFTGLSKSQKKVIIMLAADYGNLGDVAITYAQRKWLEANLNEYKVISIPISQTFRAMRRLKQIVSPEDIVTIVGGGNMGDVYEGIEEQRRFVIRSFRKNKIISFPQTVDFTDSANGKASLRRTQRTYNAHKNLVLIAREKSSFEKMQESFNAKILLTPDIVLSLDKTSVNQVRISGKVLFCLRNDKEASITPTQRRMLRDFFTRRYTDISERDTHIGDVTLSELKSEIELESIWSDFRTAEIVVTDRLHGMIFCSITGTPCIALNNANGKVEGVYNLWIKQLRNTVLLKQIDETSVNLAINILSKQKIKNISIMNGDFDSIKGLL